MSRCFPYRVRGHARNAVCGDALIEPIKRERENLRTELRSKKRERKEGKFDDVYGKLEELNVGKVGGETEQLEKSDLTEEHCSQNLCYLSDGTQGSIKRKREESPSSNGCQNDGNGLKIRISLKGLREPDLSHSKEPVCFTSGRTDSFAQQIDSANTNTNVIIIPKVSSLSDKKQHLEETQKKHIYYSAATPYGFDNTEMQRVALQYKSLIGDWAPVQFNQDEVEDDGEDWLFGKKQLEISRAKRCKVGNDVLCSSSTTLLLRARYIPEADIWALPYTVPF